MDEITSFSDFAEAFDSDLDYQTEETDVSTEEQNTEQDSGEAAPATEETPADAESQPEQDSVPTEPERKPSDSDTFTIKVNKEERTCTREEVISLAQKGADYDRVKDQLTESRQTASGLQEKLDSQQEAMDVLAEVAKDAGVEIPALLDNLRMGLLKKQGLSEDAAKERLMRLKVEKENVALKAAKPAEKPAEAEDGSQRVRRELAEFRSEYPEVDLTQELLDKLMPDVAAGKSLTAAYRAHEATQKDARIAELERQLAAEKQNKANRAASPGSQKDSGGRRTKDDFDDFLEAFK